MTSMAHPLDIGIFLGFLAVTLVVGMRYGRGVKSLRDYAIGKKDFTTATLTTTIVATWITGRYLTNRIAHIYQDGFYVIILYLLCEVGTLLLIAWVFSMRMGRFLQSTSIAEAMGDVYGRPIRSITAIFGLTVSVGLVALQFMAGAKAFSLLVAWDKVNATVITGVILIIYSAFGGIRAVTFTDVLQFFTFGTLIPILALMIWNQTSDFAAVCNMVQTTPHLNIKTFLTPSEFSKKWGLLTCIPGYILPAFAPAIFQRVTMAKDVYQARRAFLYSAVIYLFISLLIIWIAILIRTQNDKLDFGHVFPYIVENYTPVGFRGLLLVGVLAMIMSTADSNLNAAATILANDIIVPLLGVSPKPWLKVLKSHKGQLIIARVGSVVLGIVALLFSLDPNHCLHAKFTPRPWVMPWIMPWIMPWDFYMSVISVPLLVAILGFRSTTRTVLIGMAVGFLTVYCWVHLLPHAHVNVSVPGMLANLISLMGSHYLLDEPGGWQPLDFTSPLILERVARKQAWERRWRAVRTFRLYPYLRQNLPAHSQDRRYVFLGLYTVLVVYAASYTIEMANDIAYRSIYDGLYYAVLPITTTFLTLPIWSSVVKNRRFMAYFWPIGIGVIFFFAGMLLAIISHFHPIQVMILVLNFFMAVLLLRWPLALFIAFTGVAMAVFFFKNYTGMALPAGVPDSLPFRLIYGLLLLISFLIALKGKQVYRRLATSHTQLKTENNFTNQMWLTTLRCWERLHRDTTRYASQVSHRTRQLEAQLHPYSHPPTKAQLMTDNAVLHQYTYQLDVTNKHLTQVLHQAQQPMTLAIASKALTAIWKEALQTLHQHKSSTIVITQSHTACQILCADLRKIQRLLLNGLTHLASPVHNKCPILLGLEDTQLAYPIVSLPEYIKYVKAVRITMTTEKVLPRLKQWYLGSVDHAETQYPQDITAVSIAHNQQIVEAHYGFAEITTHKDGVRLVYVIPWDVRAVRPPIMDQQHEATTVSALETSVHPSEEAFVQAVHDAHNPIDETLLKQSIQLTRQYYGRIKSATGELCYLQAMAVARIVLGCTSDADTLLAALLHDVIDKTHYSLHHIALCFNPVVKRIVEGVTTVDSRLSSFKKIHLSAHEIRRKLSEVEDDRILLVKLADHLHGMRTIVGHPSLNKRKKIAEETLQFFVPIAKGLRLMSIAEELKERCLVVLSRK